MIWVSTKQIYKTEKKTKTTQRKTPGLKKKEKSTFSTIHLIQNLKRRSQCLSITLVLTNE